MKHKLPILQTTALALALSTMLFAEPPPAPAQPGYLKRGAPFALRKAPRTRPPVYTLPALPIYPDPQPKALTSINPAQPLNPANAGNPLPMVSMILAPPTQGMKLETKTVFHPMTPMISPPGTLQTGGAGSAMGAYLDPQILRYFNVDANGTYQGGLLPGSSLFTLPTLNPLLQRGSSATYQIK
jgi:hypothetical protein